MYTLEDLVNDKELTGIINDYWKDYVKHRNLEIVVKPSIPIIWFGDLVAYKNSDVKVVTVAINPSDKEFKKEVEKKKWQLSFHRFPEAKELYKDEIKDLSSKNREILITSYNKYFGNAPDTWDKTYDDINAPYSWFGCFEKIITDFFPDGLKASYHKKNICRAIHIDYQTALATREIWSYLGENSKKREKTIEEKQKEREEKKRISESGKELFVRLMEYLEPTIMLFASKNKILEKEVLTTFAKEYKERIRKRNSRGNEIISYSNDNKLFIYGTNNSIGPLKGINENDQKEWLSEIFKDYNHGEWNNSR